MMKKLFNILLFITCTIHLNAQEITVGIDEKLGGYLPMNSKVVTSEGDTVLFKSLITKPTILALVYYECPGICSPMLSELSWTIDKLELEPGIDFRVIALSFDHEENSTVSAKWKKNYLQQIKRSFDPKDWIFLTADSLTIEMITKAAGFYFKPDEEEFIHAGTLIALAPDGKISRYLFGTTFNPFDVKLALLDAQSGKTSPTINKVLQFCFSYDPAGRQYTLNVTRIIGTVMLLTVGVFASVLFFRKRKSKKIEGVDIDG